jgi:hypothetical protein
VKNNTPELMPGETILITGGAGGAQAGPWSGS